MVDKKTGEIKESVAAQRLYRKVNKMINSMDALLKGLEKKEKVMKEDLQKKGKEQVEAEDTKKARCVGEFIINSYMYLIKYF